jgi:hypothetical protein
MPGDGSLPAAPGPPEAESDPESPHLSRVRLVPPKLASPGVSRAESATGVLASMLLSYAKKSML